MSYVMIETDKEKLYFLYPSDEMCNRDQSNNFKTALKDEYKIKSFTKSNKPEKDVTYVLIIL